MTGAKLVFPGPAMDGKSIYELIEGGEGQLCGRRADRLADDAGSHAAGKLRFSTLKRTVIGGSACPPAMINAFNDDYGVEVLHAWGMTEMSPLGTVCTLKNKHLPLSSEEKMKVRLKQGRGIFGVDMKIVDPEGARTALGRQGLWRPAGQGPLDHQRILQGGGRHRRWSMAGSPPATWPPSTPMATCRSPTAART